MKRVRKEPERIVREEAPPAIRRIAHERTRWVLKFGATLNWNLQHMLANAYFQGLCDSVDAGNTKAEPKMPEYVI